MLKVLERAARDPFSLAPGDELNIVAVLTDKKTGKKRTYYGKNIVTTKGSQWYAEAAVASGSVFTPAGVTLGSSAVAPAVTDTACGSPIANGSAAADTGYPCTNDSDADNTGKGLTVVTWRFSFGTGVANANGIQEEAITNALGAGTAALQRGTMASFNKSSSDTLKLFVNHTMLGV